MCAGVSGRWRLLSHAQKCSQVANLIDMTVEVYQKLVSLHDKKMEQSLFVMYSAHQFNETGVITHTEVQ